MSKELKLHRDLRVCSGLKPCGECVDTFPQLVNGDIMVPRLLSDRDPAVDRIIKECPEQALYLVVP